MSTWIQCNVCCVSPGRRELRFYLLTCRHIVCHRCAAARSHASLTHDGCVRSTKCGACGSSSSCTPVNSSLPKQLQQCFLPQGKRLLAQLQFVAGQDKWRQEQFNANKRRATSLLKELESVLRSLESQREEKLKLARQLESEVKSLRQEKAGLKHDCERVSEELAEVERSEERLCERRHGASTAAAGHNVSLSSGGRSSRGSSTGGDRQPWPLGKRPRTPNTSKSPLAAPLSPIDVHAFATPVRRLGASFEKATTSTPQMLGAGNAYGGGGHLPFTPSPFVAQHSSLSGRAADTPVISGNVVVARRRMTPLSTPDWRQPT